MKFLNEAISVLSEGGVIAYPTDTVYGLGADALNPEAIKKVFDIKKRDFSQPISISLGKVSEIEKYTYLKNKDFIEKLMEEGLFPGPITLILPKRKILPDILTGSENSIGIRIPDHPIPIKIVEKFGRPITTTSANISSTPPVYNFQNLDKRIVEKIDYLVKGECKYKRPSTIIDLTEEPKIVRKGIKFEEIEKLLRLWSSGEAFLFTKETLQGIPKNFGNEKKTSVK